MQKVPSIGLGTVQLGMPYGTRADEALMQNAEADAILSSALSAGIRFFDTAANYGVAEERLGRFRLAKCPGVEVSTKIPRVADTVYRDETQFRRFVFDQAQSSLKVLGLDQFQLLQFHQSDIAFLKSTTVVRVMKELVDQGVCKSIGVSVYHPREALTAIESGAVKAIQIPLNLLDHRFLDLQFLEKCEAQSIRIIARSVFLQGVLVPGAKIPPVRKQLRLAFYRCEAEAIAKAFGASLDALALSFVFQRMTGISIGLLGVDSRENLEANLKTIRALKGVPTEELRNAFEKLANMANSEGILNPADWDH